MVGQYRDSAFEKPVDGSLKILIYLLTDLFSLRYA